MRLRGFVIEESLTDWRLINQLDIREVEVCESPNPGEGLWHIYTVEVSDAGQLEQLSQALKPQGYYAHFASKAEGYVVFPGRVFTVIPNEPASWQEAIRHGAVCGVPAEQLDFSFEVET